MMDLTQRYPEGFYTPYEEEQTTGQTLWYGLNRYKDEWEADPIPFHLTIWNENEKIYEGYNFDEAIAQTKKYHSRELRTYYWHDMDVVFFLV